MLRLTIMVENMSDKKIKDVKVSNSVDEKTELILDSITPKLKENEMLVSGVSLGELKPGDVKKLIFDLKINNGENFINSSYIRVNGNP